MRSLLANVYITLLVSSTRQARVDFILLTTRQSRRTTWWAACNAVCAPRQCHYARPVCTTSCRLHCRPCATRLNRPGARRVSCSSTLHVTSRRVAMDCLAETAACMPVETNTKINTRATHGEGPGSRFRWRQRRSDAGHSTTSGRDGSGRLRCRPSITCSAGERNTSTARQRHAL